MRIFYHIAAKLTMPFKNLGLCSTILNSDERRRSVLEYFELIFLFAKIGLFTFGGGYAMIPLMTRELVEKRSWATMEEIADYYAIGQCTPGIIAVNTATFIGYKRKSVLGGIAATFGLILPSMVVITIIATALNSFADYPYVVHAFAGIRVCVCVLILNAAVSFVKTSVKDVFSFVIFIVVLLGATFLDLSPALFVIGAGAASLILRAVRK